MQNQTSPLVLTFGATDPIAAIGIQADLASFAAMGCHGLSVVTAILISDTTGVDVINRFFVLFLHKTEWLYKEACNVQNCSYSTK